MVRVHAGLVERRAPPFHLEVDTGRPGAQHILPGGEAPLDGPRRRFGRRAGVGGLHEAVDDFLVAGPARPTWWRDAAGGGAGGAGGGYRPPPTPLASWPPPAREKAGVSPTFAKPC